MVSAVVLAAFVVIGLLDSVHFRLPIDGRQNGSVHYSPEVLSMLDVVAGPLREHVEKTYSAPFATRLYVKELVETREGKMVRDYPRLKYAGSHLKNPERERAADIAFSLLTALFQALFFWGISCYLLIFMLSRRQTLPIKTLANAMWYGRGPVPWRIILATAGTLFFLALAVIHLGGQYHILGTDKVGQDVLFQSLKSVRTGLVIGTITTLVMLPFAVLLGIAAGYFKGWIDDVIQYLYTTLSSIPGVLLIAAAVLIMQVYIESNPHLFDTDLARSDLRLLFLCAILGVTSWTSLCRLLRAETLKLRELEYIQAAVAFGAGHSRIILRHILPNVMHIVLITIVMDFSGLVLAEAVLSYVGVGVDPTMQSWGNMINGARLEMAREPVVWWSLAAAFLFMFALVLAANLFAETVRDALDPRSHIKQSNVLRVQSA
jgi:peptide/nickel transport system permease protein